MNTKLLGCGFACAVALAASAGAQTPPQTPPAQPPAGEARMATTGTVTVEGCLFKEVDAPGRTPPEGMRQKAETDNDYVLAPTKMIKGDAPAAKGSPAASPGTSPTGTSGVTTSGLMYEVQGLDKGKLAPHAGHRVQIDGTFENIERVGAPISYANDLVDLRATAIRMIAADCAGK
jgi:hypothetical protein